MKKALACLVVGTLALAACVGQPQRRGPPAKVVEAALRGVPGVAQPSRIVAVEVALGQLAAELTPSAAMLNYASAAAQVQQPGGLISAQQWIGSSPPPVSMIKWNTRAVVMSCDGALAASTGRFTDASGLVGNYAMIWQRESNGSYRWLHHVAAPDVPQPPPRPSAEADAGPNGIVVTALDAVQGLVASCPRRGEDLPPPPALAITDDLPGGASLSGDGTMRWRWEQRGNGTRFIAAEYFYEGRWLNGFEQPIGASASAGTGAP